MFNVFLPKLLELGPGGSGTGPDTGMHVKTLEENLWDVMIFTIGGTPGAIVCLPSLLNGVPYILMDLPFYYIQLGAWLIESSLGRRWSLALSTFTTAAFCILFLMVESVWALRLSMVGISLSATVGLFFSCSVQLTPGSYWVHSRQCGPFCTAGHQKFLGQKVCTMCFRITGITALMTIE
jgi:hypothetical protein